MVDSLLQDHLPRETFSAGVVTAAAFKHNKMGTIVGQETGGRIGFLSDPMVLQLPNSRLKALIPVAILEFPGDDPDRGVAPDVIVDHTPDDYADQRDNELEIVKRLIRNDLLAASKQ